MRVLLIEDDSATAQSIELMLKSEGFNVYTTDLGEEGVDLGKIYDYDLILLDLNLPDMSGMDVLRTLRVAKINTPIMILSGTAEIDTKVKTFTGGADDYMTKPFSMRELIARCKALFRRVDRAKTIAKNSENEKILDFGALVIDPAQRIVTLKGQEVHLTPTEFDLLATLARRPRTVLTREKLLEEVWDWVDASGTRTVDSHVKALRHKLGSATIRTVHGVGYAFEPPEPAKESD